MNYIETLGEKAKAASKVIGIASAGVKNEALAYIADALIENTDDIIKANSLDMDNAESNGISKVMQDRLRLTAERIAGMADGIRTLIRLDDPVGVVDYGITRPNGMKI
ncbi:MAG: gamma-glutamyl-phosphate reductase, partial [Oscillospiraceae bacterium]